MRVTRWLLSGCVAFGLVLPAVDARGGPTRLELEAELDAIAASSDGRWVAASPRSGKPVLFFVGDPPEPAVAGDDGEPASAPEPPPERRTLETPDSSGAELLFTADSKYLVVHPEREAAESRVLVFEVEAARSVGEIDCSGTEDRRGLSPRHVWQLVRHADPSRFLIVRRDALVCCDATTASEVWRNTAITPTDLHVAADAPAVFTSSYDGVRVYPADALGDASEPERKLVPKRLKGAKKETVRGNKLVRAPDIDVAAISSDGTVVVLECSQSEIKNRAKLEDPNLDPKERLEAIVDHHWIEAVDVETGKSLWYERTKRSVYDHHVVCADGVVAVIERGRRLKFFDVRRGSSKGTVANKDVNSVAYGSDGRWWYGTEDGNIRRR